MTESLFNSEFLPLADTLYRIARYILESGPEAEDAVQDLFLKLWESRESIEDIRQPKAYCIRMLKNICLDRIRKARHITFPERLPETGTEHSQDDEIDSRRRLDMVLEAVKSLPDRQRQILILRTVDELSYEEISRKTGINYLTCRVLLSQARSKIKTKA